MSVNFPAAEEESLRYWREIDAFQTQIRLTQDRPRFTFYDGPPFGMLVFNLVYPLPSPNTANCVCSHRYIDLLDRPQT